MRSSSVLCAAAFLVCLPPITAARLKAETVNAWDEYVREVNVRICERASPGRTFLWVDESPERLAKVRAGAIVVSEADVHPKVPSGWIHDWMSAVFIPHVSIHDVLPLLRDYNRYKELFRPGVIASHPLTLSDSEDRFSLVLANQSLFARSAVESDYKSTHVRVDDRRRYIVTQSTRVQEIADYGTSGQHTLPEGEGLGLLWRMFGITRLEERDGGVYVELEAIALSRDVPRGLRWLAEPIVRRVARTSLTQSLRQTRDAVEANRTLPAGAAAGR